MTLVSAARVSSGGEKVSDMLKKSITVQQHVSLKGNNYLKNKVQLWNKMFCAESDNFTLTGIFALSVLFCL